MRFGLNAVIDRSRVTPSSILRQCTTADWWVNLFIEIPEYIWTHNAPTSGTPSFAALDDGRVPLCTFPSFRVQTERAPVTFGTLLCTMSALAALTFHYWH